MTMKINLDPEHCFGFWKESETHLKSYEWVSFPRRSIYDFLDRQIDPENDVKIYRYLSDGHVFLGYRGIGRSIFDPEISLPGELSFHCDGKWMWLSNVSFYFETTTLSLPKPFYENIVSNNFSPPVFSMEERKIINSQFKEIIKR